MKVFRLVPFVAAAALMYACSPTEPLSDISQAQFDAVNPASLEFASVSGLPADPFNAAGPGSRADDKRAGAAFPDSLKLTATQLAKIKALRDAFYTNNKTDLDALHAIHTQVEAARKAGKSRDEIKALLQSGKAIADRLQPKLEALRTSSAAVLTALQKAWIEAHKPAGVPAGWVGPGGRP